MNDEPKFSNFSAPPSAPSGAGRLLPLMRTAATGGLIVALTLYSAQLLLPDYLKPSVVAGRAAGDTVRAEIEASREAKIDVERRVADATAQAQAKAQADVIAMQTALTQRTETLQTQSQIAGLADLACFGSMAIASMGRENTGADWHNGAVAVGQSSCGVGDQLRSSITQSQLAAVREAAAARDAPMTDGSVRASRTLPDRPLSLADVYGISTSPLHFTAQDVEDAKKWIGQFSADVQQHLYANVTNDVKGGDLLVMRATAYSRFIHS